MRGGFLDLAFDVNDSGMADKGLTFQDLLPVSVSLSIPQVSGSSAHVPAGGVASITNWKQLALMLLH